MTLYLNYAHSFYVAAPSVIPFAENIQLLFHIFKTLKAQL